MERKNYLIDTNVAIYYYCSLITNNIKDFDKINGLHLIKV